MDNAYDEDKLNEKMKSITFDEDGRPIVSDAAPEESAVTDAEQYAQGADETAETNETAKAGQHKPGIRELKEKISGLGLEIEVLKSELEKARKETEAYINLAQRAKADFDNFKKRNTEQSRLLRAEGLADGILSVLPVYDALTKASEMINDENTLKGLYMIAQRLAESFKELGVEKIESLGQDFDPAFHNAVMNEEAGSDEAKGKVTEVFQEGFKMGDRILRYAMVKVAI